MKNANPQNYNMSNAGGGNGANDFISGDYFKNKGTIIGNSPHVDRVRQRAGLAKLSDVKPGLSQAAFLTQLMHERVTELTGEDVRWMDLARWGFFDDQSKVDQLKARDFEFNNFTVGKNKYLPIPQSEIDINPNLVQNDLY